MTQSKKAIALIIFLFLGLALLILYIFSELLEEAPNSFQSVYSFKDNYEKLNDNSEYLKINIKDDKKIELKNEFDILDMIENKESFIVYFGFEECNWCRSTLESFIKNLNNSNIEKIYYVNISDIRDNYELNSKNELIKTVEGTEGYYKLLKAFDSILDNYEPLSFTDSKGKVTYVDVQEKRIYAPTYAIIKNGIPVTKVSGISKLQKNELSKINDEIKKEQDSIFEDFFNKYSTNQNTCSVNDTKC